VVAPVIDEEQIAGEALREGHPLLMRDASDYLLLIAVLYSFPRHAGDVPLPLKDSISVEQAVTKEESPGLCARPTRGNTIVLREQQLQIIIY